MTETLLDTVLYVEDDFDLRETVADALKDFGFQVEQAEHGAAALAALDAGLRPLAIVTDLMMPQMSGWELVARVRRTPGLQQTPIIVMSAVAENAPLDVDAVFAKPIDILALEHELRRIRRRSGTLHAL
jgi:CheY-like chemotaxis protein